MTVPGCRVCRRKLRAHLVQQCAAQGVRYLAGEVVDVQGDLQDDEVCITLDTGRQVTSRYLTSLWSRLGGCPQHGPQAGAAWP